MGFRRTVLVSALVVVAVVGVSAPLRAAVLDVVAPRTITRAEAASAGLGSSAEAPSTAPQTARLPWVDRARPAPAQADAAGGVGIGPRLSLQQNASAESIARGSAALKHLAAGGFRITDTRPWTPFGSLTVIGAELDVLLAAPLNGTATLPGLRYGASSTPTSKSVHVRLTGTTRLSVLVDLRSRAVVSIDAVDGDVADAGGNTSDTLTTAQGE